MGNTSSSNERIYLVTIYNDPELRWYIKIENNWTFQDLFNEMANKINHMRGFSSEFFTFQDGKQVNFLMDKKIWDFVKPDQTIHLYGTPDVNKIDYIKNLRKKAN
jgi:hypothetical protein